MLHDYLHSVLFYLGTRIVDPDPDGLVGSGYGSNPPGSATLEKSTAYLKMDEYQASSSFTSENKYERKLSIFN